MGRGWLPSRFRRRPWWHAKTSLRPPWVRPATLPSSRPPSLPARRNVGIKIVSWRSSEVTDGSIKCARAMVMAASPSEWRLPATVRADYRIFRHLSTMQCLSLLSDIHLAGRTCFKPLRLRLVGDAMDCAESYHLGTDRAETLATRRSFRAQSYMFPMCKGSICHSDQQNPRRGLGTDVRSGV